MKLVTRNDSFSFKDLLAESKLLAETGDIDAVVLRSNEDATDDLESKESFLLRPTGLSLFFKLVESSTGSLATDKWLIKSSIMQLNVTEWFELKDELLLIELVVYVLHEMDEEDEVEEESFLMI